jgi:membrane peptidoglycan carboxypeptidase
LIIMPTAKFNPNSVYFFIKPLFNIFRWFFLSGGVILIIAIIGGGVWLSGRYNALGSIKERITTPSQGSVVYDRNGEEMFRYYDSGEKREIVGLEDIPEAMQLAVIAMEDENFYYNEDGIPWSNLAGSAIKCLRPSSGECRGGSGLSQQLIKKTITNRTTATLDNKIDELLGAYKFNQEVSKQDVIRLYLNVVPFGRNTYGVQEAVKSYFGKNINDKKDGKFALTIPEACFVGSMLPKPEGFAVAVREKLNGKETDNWKELEFRKNFCIDKLTTKQIRGVDKPVFISPTEGTKLKSQEVKFLAYKAEDQKYGHIKNFITEELVGKYKNNTQTNPFGLKSEADLLTRGLKIKTTFDLKLQTQLEDTTRRGVEKFVKPNGGNNSASIILDGPTGQILAMVGSVDFNNKDIQGEVNMITSARQPGSSIKPFVYASAFENGFNPGTMLLDQEIDFGGGYKPKNFDKTFNGPVSIRYALQNSLNIPAVKALYLSSDPTNKPDGEGALDNFKKFLDKTGNSFPFWAKGVCGVATALGGCEVKMLDHATGVNTLLQEGRLTSATPFLEISAVEKNFVNGQTTNQDLYNLAVNSPSSPYPKKDDAINPLVARQVANVMSDYASRNVKFWGNTMDNLMLKDWTGDNQIAAKTGTTNDYKDAWTVGGSPYYTVVTWAGNANGKPMDDRVASASIAGPIWHEIMVNIHKEKVKKGFSKDGLESYAVGNSKTELLTKDQIQKLKDAKSATKDKNSIFYTRSIYNTKSVKINKIDGKLIPSGTEWPEALTENVSCGGGGSEFPEAKNWGGWSDKSCPTETSDLKPDAGKVSVSTNLTSGSVVSGPFTISANHPAGDDKIESIELRIDGQPVATGPGASFNGNITGISGSKTVQIAIRDTFGTEQTITYPGVIFGQGSSSTSNCVVNGTKVMLLPGQSCDSGLVPQGGGSIEPIQNKPNLVPLKN